MVLGKSYLGLGKRQILNKKPHTRREVERDKFYSFGSNILSKKPPCQVATDKINNCYENTSFQNWLPGSITQFGNCSQYLYCSTQRR